MESKDCKKCGKHLPLCEYHKHPYTADRHVATCKSCEKLRKRDPRTKEEKAAHMAKYIAKPEVKARVSEKQKIWRGKNQAKLRAKCRAEQAAKIKRTPAWANKKEIEKLYEKAREMTLKTGQPHHVDHIIPMQGKLVSGLNVENNLQVILASENWKKSNKYATA